MTTRATLTATDGTTETREIDSDTWDALVDEYETTDSPYPVGVRERQRKDGTWVVVGGWDVRPRQATTTQDDPAARHAAAVERNREEMAAAAAVNDATDRRENRRSYYLRTGR